MEEIMLQMLIQLPTVGGLLIAVIVLRDELRQMRAWVTNLVQALIDANDNDAVSQQLERRLHDLNGTE